MEILLTNDDGIHAPGLRSMYAALGQAGHTVCVVAPLTEQSAVGHAVTMSMPLKIRPVEEPGFSGLGVPGYPADCVKLALCSLMDKKPDLVVSGINAGANVGVDVLYSGTVSAATEAALMGVRALSVSVDDFRPTDLTEQARYTADFIERQPWAEMPLRRVLNLNFPKLPMSEVKGLRVCPQTRAVYKDWYVKRQDPRGNDYYWLQGVIPADSVTAGADRALLTEGFITLTPLKFELTDWDLIEELKRVHQDRA